MRNCFTQDWPWRSQHHFVGLLIAVVHTWSKRLHLRWSTDLVAPYRELILEKGRQLGGLCHLLWNLELSGQIHVASSSGNSHVGSHWAFKCLCTAGKDPLRVHAILLSSTNYSLEMHFVAEVLQYVSLHSLKLRHFRCWTIAAEYFSFIAFM